MKLTKVLVSDDPDCNVVILNHPEDPTAWIVRKYKKILFLRRCLHSRWFHTREQAERYAGELARVCRQGS